MTAKTHLASGLNNPLPARRALLGVLASAAFTCNAGAVILANDNFTLSSGTDVASLTDTQSAGVGTYNNILTPAQGDLSATTLAGFGSGNVMQIHNGNNTMFRAFNSGPTQLSNLAVGERLSLSFDVRFAGTLGTAANNFGFGFLGSSDSVAFANIDATATPTSEFRYRLANVHMGDSGAGNNVVVGDTWDDTTASDTNYRFTFSITNLNDTDYQLRYLRDGTELASATHPLTAVENINITGIGFRWANGPGVHTYIDNVLVEVIPEPSSVLLLCGGLSALLLRRKRVN